MKSTTVRGTPVRSIVAGKEGIAPSVPQNMNGQTVNQEFEADHRGYQTDPRSGTPYRSNAGNPADYRREVVRDARGLYTDPTGTAHNDPKSNGNGVLFDGMSRANAQSPIPAPAIDAPVPRDAPVFDPHDMVVENRAHLGEGDSAGPISDTFLEGGDGVMSRD
jgi:hypothetical protein